MTADALQWGALGVLLVVLVGLGAAGKMLVTRVLGPFVDTLVKVGVDNVDTNRALREAMVSQGGRLTVVTDEIRALREEVETVGDMVQDIHAVQCGSKRTSSYGRERDALKQRKTIP